MKKLLVIASIALFASSCQTVRLTDAGKLNMVSDRNVDLKNRYVLLKSYAGASNKELKKTTAISLSDAVDETVKRVKGGEFLMNAHFYVVEHHKRKKSWVTYAVEGDVWGMN